MIFTSAQCRNFQHETLPNLTVSLSLIHDVAAGTAREFSDNGPGQILTQGGDRIGHVALRASDCPVVCNLGGREGFLEVFLEPPCLSRSANKKP